MHAEGGEMVSTQEWRRHVLQVERPLLKGTKVTADEADYALAA